MDGGDFDVDGKVKVSATKITRFPSSVFDSFQLLMKHIKGTFSQELAPLQLAHLIDDPTPLEKLMREAGCGRAEPRQPDEVPHVDPNNSTREERDDYNSKVETYNRQMDLREKWITRKDKAERAYRVERQKGASWVLYLFAAFPNDERAKDIESRIREMDGVIGSTVDLSKPSTVLAEIRRILEDSSTQSSHNIGQWLKEMTSAVLDPENLPTKAQLTKLTEVLTRLADDFEKVFYGSSDCKRETTCRQVLQECDCCWSKRVLNLGTILLTHLVATSLPSSSSDFRMAGLRDARNAFCGKPLHEMSRDDVSSFVSLISKFKGDTYKDAGEIKKKVSNKPVNRLTKSVDGQHNQPDLPATRKDWESTPCSFPKHTRKDHTLAQCRVALTKAKTDGKLKSIGLEDLYTHYVENRQTGPPTETGSRPEKRKFSGDSKFGKGKGQDSSNSRKKFKSSKDSEKSTYRVTGSDQTGSAPGAGSSDSDDDDGDYFSHLTKGYGGSSVDLARIDDDCSLEGEDQEATDLPPQVIVDTGCRHTTLNTDQLFRSAVEYDQGDPYVTSAGGHRLRIVKQGTMVLNLKGDLGSRVHESCLLVPECRENLFSLTFFLTENPDVCAVATGDGMWLLDASTVRDLLKMGTRLAFVSNGSYVMDPRLLSVKQVYAVSRPGAAKAAVSFATETDSHPHRNRDVRDIWYKYHRRCGHSDLKGWEEMLSVCIMNKSMLKQILETGHDCVVCAIGKLRYRSPRATDRPAMAILQRVHVDTFPLPLLERNGRRYCTLLVEEYSRFKHVFFTNHINEEEVGKRIVSTLKNWSTKTGAQLLELRSDGGGESCNNTVNSYLESIGAVHKTSPSYTQALNGLVESNIGRLKDMARCMLLDSHICIDFTPYALEYAAALSNLPIHPFTKSSPYEVWHRRKPRLEDYLPFGCLVAVLEPKETRDKSGIKGKLGVYLGIKGTDLAMIFTFEDQRVRHEKQIKPFPERFPGLKRSGLKFLPFIDPTNFSQRFPEPNQVESAREKLLSSWEHAENVNLGDIASQTAKMASTSLPIEHSPLRGSVTDDIQEKSVNNGEASIADEKPMVDLTESVTATLDQPTQESEAVRDINSSDPESLENSNHQTSNAAEMDTAAEVVAVEMGNDSNLTVEDIAAEIEYAPPESDIEIRELRGGRWRAVDVGRVFSNHMTPKPKFQKVKQRKPDPDFWEFKGPGIEPDREIKVLDAQPPPAGFRQVELHPFRDYWISAMQQEMASLKSKDTFRECELPPGRKPVGLVWKFKYKTKGEYIAKFKARLCVLGNTQTPGVDYDPENIFAPVMRGSTMRAALALMGPKGPRKMHVTQADYTLAFLNASPKEQVYVKAARGFPTEHPSHVLLLLRSLYGLCQSPREWYEYLRAWLREQGFTESKSDPCMFTRRDKDNQLEVILVYVDDTLIFASSKELADAIKAAMRQKFEMTDVEDADKVIGVELFRVEGGLCLGQPVYTKMMLEEAGYWDVDLDKLPMNPISENWTHDDNSELLTGVDRDFFVSYLMKIAWMSQQTRIDLAATASVLAQYLSKPTKSDLAALRRCLLYLRGSWDDALFYRDDKAGEIIVEDPSMHDQEEPGLLFAYADASFANEEGRKSRSGQVVMMNGAAIDWASKKQSMVALSSTEAEYYSVSQVTQSVLHFKKILADLDAPIAKPIRIYEDNKSCIAIAYKPKHHGRTKHFDVKAHFIRDHVEKEDIEVIYCPTDLMVADMLTKALPPGQHQRLKRFAGLRSLSKMKIVKLND